MIITADHHLPDGLSGSVWSGEAGIGGQRSIVRYPHRMETDLVTRRRRTSTPERGEP
jgi:hypothetical protein